MLLKVILGPGTSREKIENLLIGPGQTFGLRQLGLELGT